MQEAKQSGKLFELNLLYGLVTKLDYFIIGERTNACKARKTMPQSETNKLFRLYDIPQGVLWND